MARDRGKFWDVLIRYDRSEIKVHDRSLGSVLLSCVLACRRARSEVRTMVLGGPVVIGEDAFEDAVRDALAIYSRMSDGERRRAAREPDGFAPEVVRMLMGGEKVRRGVVTGGYAPVSWTPNDIRTLRPGWGLAKCARFLGENESYIQERLVELGWDVIGDLLSRERAGGSSAEAIHEAERDLSREGGRGAKKASRHHRGARRKRGGGA